MSGLSGKNVILGITGGIAAYKAAELARRLKDVGASVRVVMTQAATHFISPLTLQAVSGQPVRLELLDSEAESGMDHIEFARWADVIVVAPATANFLARLNVGLADDLLTTLCLASEAPIVAAPAMNRVMWSKSVTQRNVRQLVADGIRLIGPGVGDQACGETGPGRMVEAGDIVAFLTDLFDTSTLATGLKVMITAGPTFEPIDPVRGITNHSSGKMGYALAEAFHRSGADVTLVSGPCHLPPPPVGRKIDVQSALDMHRAVHEFIAGQDIFISVAAVADYRPQTTETHKIKKSGDSVTLTLVRNPDILASVAALESPPFCVGFAAETHNVEQYARGKLQAKQLDLIAANLVGTDEGGFKSDDNALLVISRDDMVRIGPASKREVAHDLCRLILNLYEPKHSTQDT